MFYSLKVLIKTVKCVNSIFACHQICQLLTYRGKMSRRECIQSFAACSFVNHSRQNHTRNSVPFVIALNICLDKKQEVGFFLVWHPLRVIYKYGLAGLIPFLCWELRTSDVCSQTHHLFSL